MVRKSRQHARVNNVTALVIIRRNCVLDETTDICTMVDTKIRGQMDAQKEPRQSVIAALPKACSDEYAAVEFIEEMRWGGYPACPRCGSMDVYQMVDRGGERQRSFRWRCRDCAKLKESQPQFTVRTGTVFEESRLPLRHWCYAFWRASTSKKGVSAKEIQRQCGISYKSALFMMHRIRYAMTPDPAPPLTGTVEVDETYVGGKPRYKGKSKVGRGTEKTPVVALVERGGKVRTYPIADVTGKTLRQAIRENVDPSARIMTDGYTSYRGVGSEFEGGHETVNHTAGEYVRGDCPCDTAESFFSRMKRSLNGIHHAVSKRHLHRYCTHMEFLHNNRSLTDGERTMAAIQSADGKRLYYKER